MITRPTSVGRTLKNIYYHLITLLIKIHVQPYYRTFLNHQLHVSTVECPYSNVSIAVVYKLYIYVFCLCKSFILKTKVIVFS